MSKEQNSDAPISKVYIDEYNGNTSTSNYTSLHLLNIDLTLKGLFLNTDFHTHPTAGHSRYDIERASGPDKRYRDNNRVYFKNFLILTREENYPYNVKRVNYNHQ